ncbi:hypothetical protein AMTR_s00137p00078850 [Amborella trichopoda]|uniref:Uncharacterized protein n=1 Tax=Amborella trichopoda TaxID=13333 RepID=W1NET7_AMBTC|nr:hypothetical protein AMTR_s00137p00078850 [Amborella trichopoda]
MGFLFDAMRRAREAIFENNIWNEEILEIVDHRWRDQLHQDIHAARFFFNPQNLYSNTTLDDAYIMEGVINCIYRLESDLELIWSVCNSMDKKDMGMDMDDDYTQDEDDAQDAKIDRTIENNWQEPFIQECEAAQHDVVPDE